MAATWALILSSDGAATTAAEFMREAAAYCIWGPTSKKKKYRSYITNMIYITVSCSIYKYDQLQDIDTFVNSPGGSFHPPQLGPWHLRAPAILGRGRGLCLGARLAARDEQQGDMEKDAG